MKLILILLMIPLKVYSNTRAYDCVSSHEGRIVHVEKHREVFVEGKLRSSGVLFFDSEGKIIGTMFSEFQKSPERTSYILKDHRHGNIQGIRWNQDQLQTFTQKFTDKKAHIEEVVGLQNYPLVSAPDLVIFLQGILGSIELQDGLIFQYVIPGRRHPFDFSINLLSVTEPLVELEVTMGSWPMNLLGPHMKFIFDRSAKQLLFYRGPASIRSEEGRMISVDTECYYEN